MRGLRHVKLLQSYALLSRKLYQCVLTDMCESSLKAEKKSIGFKQVYLIVSYSFKILFIQSKLIMSYIVRIINSWKYYYENICVEVILFIFSMFFY